MIQALYNKLMSTGPLQRPAVRASFWTFTSYGASQALRLASNLILTRLLFPEAFGLMLIVNVTLQGFQMLSDLGLAPSIIQNPRGEEPRFLWTAWTIQIIRGVCLYLAALLLTYPLALHFSEPMLLQVFPVISLVLLIDGFASTKGAVMYRQLHLGRVAALDLGSYVLSVLVMIAGALVWKSVWPLIIGGLVYNTSCTILTHLILGGPKMRLMMDRELAHEIIRFGKWLFLSSMLAFLAGQLDKLILSYYLPLDPLGVYSIALTFSLVFLQVLQRLSSKVLFPLYAKTAREDVRYLRRQTRKVRLVLMLVCLPPMWLLIAVAPELITLLYDDRYQDAGWMLQLLAIGATAQCVLYPVESVLMSVGDSYRHMLLQLIRSIVLFLCMVVGGHYYGTYGYILGFAIASVAYYPALVVLVRKYRVWLPDLDLGALGLSAIVLAGVFFVRMELNLPVFWTPAATPAQYLGPQVWTYPSEEPVLSLGEPGAFDDKHLFAPCVDYAEGRFTLWYSGAQGDVADRVFRLGRAVSADGLHFEKDPTPVLAFADGATSILTPTLLRGADGKILREQGKLQLWFSGADLTQPSPPHTLHRAESEDGIAWSAPSAPLLENVYAPTILRDQGKYRLWYTDVSGEVWVIRHAESKDGASWTVSEPPAIVIDQDWEQDRLFYPTVVKHDGLYLMWYGAYWSARPNTTAIGFAVSTDGLEWQKHPMNPVLRPNPARTWESHYTTSQSVLRLPDGAWQMWYATRPAPPFESKYFAIGAAHWNGPYFQPLRLLPWEDRAPHYREQMRRILALPEQRVPLDAQVHRERQGEGYRVESISYASEAGSRVTALLWLPQPSAEPAPAVVLACGHGGSKSAPYAQYAGQLFTRLGIACLAVDTIGEEERSVVGGMGTREHDLYALAPEERIRFIEEDLKRPVLGKLAWDLQVGLDYLQSRPEIDGARLGIAGHSLGGASAGAVAVLNERIQTAIISGWGFSPLLVRRGKECTRLPYEAFADLLRFDEMTALLAPHAATLFYSGTDDAIIDAEEGGGALVRDILQGIDGARRILTEAEIPHVLEARFEEGADHRPFFLAPDAAAWLQEHLQPAEARRPLPETTVRFGDWVEAHGQQLEALYCGETRAGGLRAVEIGATLYAPEELACFPGQAGVGPEYDFQGWVDTVLSGASVAAASR